MQSSARVSEAETVERETESARRRSWRRTGVGEIIGTM
jgi:hypothetical protein